MMMTSGIDIEKATTVLYKKYGFLDPAIEKSDIYSMVLYAVLIKKASNITSVRFIVFALLDKDYTRWYNERFVGYEKAEKISYIIDTEKKRLPSKYKIGKLCKRNHRWKDTNKSLRYKSNTACIKCQLDKLKKINGRNNTSTIHDYIKCE